MSEGQLLEVLGVFSGEANAGNLIGSFLFSGVGSAILMTIVGFIKNKMAKTS